jgi:hypothetical protein
MVLHRRLGITQISINQNEGTLVSLSFDGCCKVTNAGLKNKIEMK